jgi:hypothetical protein
MYVIIISFLCEYTWEIHTSVLTNINYMLIYGRLIYRSIVYNTQKYKLC